MTGLSTALTTLVDSLSVNQQRMNYASENIANANTVGYTRKIVSQETRVANGVALGVSIAEIERAVDDFLLEKSWSQTSITSEASTLDTYYDRLQNFAFGNPDSSFTINNSLNNFYSSLEQFSNDPGSAVKRSLAIDSAQTLANSFSELANNIQQERLNADSELDGTIDTLNASLETLYDLNLAIRQNAQSGSNVGSLLDARDVEIAKVKEIADVTVFFNENDQVSLNMNNIEVLGEGQLYKLTYNRVSSVDALINNTPTDAINVQAVNSEGDFVGTPETILSASDDENQVDNIATGKLSALLQLRDVELNKTLDQLDNMASAIAFEFNEVHNNGTGFPPPTALNGSEEVSLNNDFFFDGNFRIVLTDSNGSPIQDRYNQNMPPLDINFAEFDGGAGKGTANVQSIINEINSRFGLQEPQIVNLGPAQDIRVASISDAITSVKASGTISLSAQPSAGETFVINGETFTFITGNSSGNQISIGDSISSTIDNAVVVLNASTNANVATATYARSGASQISITFDGSGASGNAFTLDASGAASATASGATLAGGANATGSLELDFDLGNYAPDGQDITFDITNIAVDSGAVTFTDFTDQTIKAGERRRTDLNGITSDSFSVNLDGTLEEGDSFTVSATVLVTDADGNTYQDVIDFNITIPDPESSIKNKRFAAASISGSGAGEVLTSSSNNPFLQASLVDANGNVITTDDTPGFLKIQTSSDTIRFTIDQLDSKELGQVGVSNVTESATNKGFAHFFGLNNLFETGAEVQNSAINFAVSSNVISSPQALSSGRAVRSTQTGEDAVYTYEVGSGSSSTALDLVKLQDKNITFGSTGELPSLFTTMNAYATEVYSFAALQANAAENEYDKQQLLKEAIENRISDISGVNVDQELADTIGIQNYYTASARILGTVKEMLETLTDTLA